MIRPTISRKDRDKAVETVIEGRAAHRKAAKSAQILMRITGEEDPNGFCAGIIDDDLGRPPEQAVEEVLRKLGIRVLP